MTSTLHAYIEAVEKRVSEATVAPWSFTVHNDRELGEFATVDDKDGHFLASDLDRKDAELIANAPQDLSRLAAALRVAVDGLKLSCYCDDPAYRSVEPCFACEHLASIERILSPAAPGSERVK